MFSFQETPPEFKRICDQSKSILEDLVRKVALEGEEFLLPPETDLFEDPANCERIFVMKEGHLKCERGGKVIFLYDEGDLVGMERVFFDFDGKIFAEFGSALTAYKRSEFFKAMAASPDVTEEWTRFLASQMNIYASIISTSNKEDVQQQPDFKMFNPGEVILDQGTKGNDVFVLVDGQADVFVDGTKVGEVFRDEIFGAFAALTGTERTATVKAAQPCSIMSMPTDNFKKLLETHPNTIIKMVENMARIIVGLNAQVVSLTKKPPVL